MEILNASKRSFNIMLDRGDILSISPGTLSKSFVATRNTILAAINLGTPDEVGIILGGTWEQSIASQVSAGQPYYYCSIDEAKAKLIDPTIDYSLPMKNTQVESLKLSIKSIEKDNEMLRKIIGEKDELIKELNDKLNLNAESKIDQIKVKNLEDANNELTTKLKSISSELEGEKSTNIELKNQLNKLTAEKQALSEKLDILSENNGNLMDKCTKLENKLEIAESDKDNLSNQLDKTKLALEQASNQIDSMKTTFNGVCDQFGIEYTSEGKWIQNKD